MLPFSLSNSLAIDADPVIAKVLARGGTRTAKPSGEVTAVRTMTLDGFDQIAAAWAPTLKNAGYGIDLKAVFCHSAPQVTFAPVPHPNFSGGPKVRQCELADLLIVFDHVDPATNVTERRAALVQAKMLKSGAISPSGQEWVQHELLAWRPVFTFVNKMLYNNRSRDFEGMPQVGSPRFSTEYGGIDLKSTPPEWRHEVPLDTKPWFRFTASLASYLAGMATGNPACGRDAICGGSDDWSFTIDELLQVTANQTMSKRRTTFRGNDNFIGLVVDNAQFASFRDGGGGLFTEGEAAEWPEGPISAVHMTFTQSWLGLSEQFRAFR